MYSAQLGEMELNLDWSKLQNLDWSKPSTIATQLGLPEVDLLKAVQSGGLPEAQKQLALAATQTSLFQNVVSSSQAALKSVAESKAGQFVVKNWIPILGASVVLVYLAFFRSPRRVVVAANPRKHRKHRKHRK